MRLPPGWRGSRANCAWPHRTRKHPAASSSRRVAALFLSSLECSAVCQPPFCCCALFRRWNQDDAPGGRSAALQHSPRRSSTRVCITQHGTVASRTSSFRTDTSEPASAPATLQHHKRCAAFHSAPNAQIPHSIRRHATRRNRALLSDAHTRRAMGRYEERTSDALARASTLVLRVKKKRRRRFTGVPRSEETAPPLGPP